MDNQIFFFFYNLAHHVPIFDQIVVFTAIYFPYIVVILAGLFILFHHEVLKAEEPLKVFWEKKREILKVFLSGVIAYLAAELLKFLFHVPRPFLVLSNINPLFVKTSFSFPSEHATFFMALAFSIFFLHKKAGYFFMFFALLIGIARIIAGVHFPVDILGGFLLGGIIAYLVAYFVKSV